MRFSQLRSVLVGPWVLIEGLAVHGLHLHRHMVVQHILVCVRTQPRSQLWFIPELRLLDGAIGSSFDASRDLRVDHLVDSKRTRANHTLDVLLIGRLSAFWICEEPLADLNLRLDRTLLLWLVEVLRLLVIDVLGANSPPVVANPRDQLHVEAIGLWQLQVLIR